MVRLTLASIACLVFVSVSEAALMRRAGDRLSQRRVDRQLVGTPPAPASNAELVITEDTEIKLDGRVCQYADVPEDADVVLLELSADKKAVLRIHFQTKK